MTSRVNPVVVIDAVFAHFGGVTNLARRLNLSRTALYLWRDNGRIPELRCYHLADLSEGKFSADYLLSVFNY